MKRIKERGRFQEENVLVLFLLHKAYVPAIIMYHDRAEEYVSGPSGPLTRQAM